MDNPASDRPASTRGDAVLVTATSIADPCDHQKFGLIALTRTRVPMVITDPRQADNPIILANESFLAMTGYSGAEIIGRNCRFLQGPKTDPATVAQIREAVADRRELTVEILNYHRDGRPFWNQLLISPVFDEAGEIRYFFASQLDVTATHAAQDLEAAEHRLLKEVDHRAKNALALVQSIMRLSRSQDAEAYAHIVQGRVDALARAHSALADGKWRGVPISRLIEGEIEPFGRRRIQLAGPDVQIASAQVQPLTLLLHEMLENAARHGALSRVEGRILVDWSLDGEDALVLHWRESGVPGNGIKPEPALGLRMITTMVERQLRGASVFRWQASGLEAEFIFPMTRGLGEAGMAAIAPSTE